MVLSITCVLSGMFRDLFTFFFFVTRISYLSSFELRIIRLTFLVLSSLQHHDAGQVEWKPLIQDPLISLVAQLELEPGFPKLEFST